MANLLAAILQKLDFRTWYNMAMLLSFLCFILAAMDKLTFAPKNVLLLATAGIFFIAYGEYLNHYTRKDRLPIAQDSTGIYFQETETSVRANKTSGIISVFIGIGLSVAAVYQYLF